MTPTIEEIIKTDRLGRRITSRERREALLREFDRSGMNAAQYAKWVGMKYSTFISWVQNRVKQKDKTEVIAEQKRGSIEWVEAVVAGKPTVVNEKPKSPAQSDSSIMVVHGPAGIRMELREEGHVMWAAKLMRLVEKPC